MANLAEGACHRKPVLHEGTRVEITGRLEGWCEITIADGKKGWLEEKTIETI